MTFVKDGYPLFPQSPLLNCILSKRRSSSEPLARYGAAFEPGQQHQTTRRAFSNREVPKSVTLVFRRKGRLRRESSALPEAADSHRRRPSRLKTTVMHFKFRIHVCWSGAATFPTVKNNKYLMCMSIAYVTDLQTW